MKKPNFTPLLAPILTIFWIVGCSSHTDQLQEASPNEATADASTDDAISGAVYSIEGASIEGASVVYLGQVVAQTDDLGEFTIEPGVIPEDATLSFAHPDYVTVFKNLSPNLKLDVYLNPIGEILQIVGSESQRVDFGGTGSLSIPAGVFQLTSGEVYTGPIELSVSFIDVTDSRQIRAAPASFIAEDEEGKQRPLQSYGMLDIGASTPDGEVLEVRQGGSIAVEIPIIIEDTPEEVNLYSLDEETGLWDLDGKLTNDGSRLLGQITNTGAWNADEPCADSLICVKVLIDDPNNLGCGVAAEGLSYAGFDGLYTPDADGYVYLNVCPNSVFELQACFPLCIPCPGPIYTAVIDLSTIPINPDGCTDIGVFVLN